MSLSISTAKIIMLNSGQVLGIRHEHKLLVSAQLSAQSAKIDDHDTSCHDHQYFISCHVTSISRGAHHCKMSAAYIKLGHEVAFTRLLQLPAATSGSPLARTTGLTTFRKRRVRKAGRPQPQLCECTGNPSCACSSMR